MEEAAGAEFLDWEMLHDSQKSSNFHGIGGDSDSDGIIKSDYFSLSNHGRREKAVAELSEDGSVESDNPSWIDPSSENRYGRINSGELWSDSGSDRSKTESVLEELSVEKRKFESPESSFFIGDAHNCLGFEEFDEIQPEIKDLSEFWSDSRGDELVSAKPRVVGKEMEMNLGLEVKVERDDEDSVEKEKLLIEETKAKTEGGDEGKGKFVWWKVPFEVLKYCLFRANPVWSFSVAAAVMGFMILGRKLYKMKRKSQSLQLKVTVDDKKVSQFMSRAARLNEAFSVVRRVPIIRPALPAPGNGISPWPAMSMR